MDKRQSFTIGLPLLILGMFVLLLALTTNEDVSVEPHTASADVTDISLADARSEQAGSTRVPEFDRDSNSSTGNSLTELAVKESLTRLRLGQLDEAILELDPLLETYDTLSDADKLALISGYANYFLAQRDFESVTELYDLALQLQDLPPQDELKILRTLGQLSLFLEQYEDGIAYFDRYFAAGGDIDSVVSLTLARNHKNLGNNTEAFDYLRQHIGLVIEEERDLRPELYRRTYADLDDVIFEIPDRSAAIEFARELANTFDTQESWKNLAEIYLLDGQEPQYNEVIELATARGFYTGGAWVE